MTIDVLAILRARRREIECELALRLDEVDRLIERATPKAPPRPAGGTPGRRSRALTVSDIFGPEIRHALLTTAAVTTADIKRLLSTTQPGPTVSAWNRRARTLGVELDEIVERTAMEGGGVGYSLTEKGRELLDAEGSPAPEH